MYIRVKKRKNKSGKELQYAYLISSKFYKKGPRQKIKEYLGRVYHSHAEKNSLKKITKQWPNAIKELLEQELKDHSFIQTINSQQWLNGEIIIDLSKREVKNNEGQKSCLKLNEGFLCDYTLNQLLSFKTPQKKDHEVGKALGNILLLAGVNIGSEQFIELFNQLRQTYNQQSQTMHNNTQQM